MNPRARLLGRLRASRLRGGPLACGLAAATVGLSAATAVLAPGAALANGSSGAWSFKSQPRLHPPQLIISTKRKGTDSGLLFLDPFRNGAAVTPEVGQPGALLTNLAGNPVWFHPARQRDFDVNLQPQTFGGRPVLTYWEGIISVSQTGKVPVGAPETGAVFRILDQHYRTLKTIKGLGGWTPDFHEFLITNAGTAIYTVARTARADLSQFHGSRHGTVEDNGVQAIDLSTGMLLYTWDMADNVSLSQAETPVPKTGVWDPFHINSIDIDAAGSLLLSVRNTWSLYDVTPTAAPGSTVNWVIDAKPKATDSSYTFGPGARFSWQHDARFLPGNRISLFDDHCCALNQTLKKPYPFARGLILKADPVTMKATVAATYSHRPSLLVPSLGNLQNLGGKVFVGWGQQPFFSEYTASGKTLFEGSLPAADVSYRTLLLPWVGLPATKPSVKVVSSGGGETIYVSWNGATEVQNWRVLGGAHAGHLTPVRTVKKLGFETTIHVARAAGPLFQVQALGVKHKLLGTSATAHG